MAALTLTLSDNVTVISNICLQVERPDKFFKLIILAVSKITAFLGHLYLPSPDDLGDVEAQEKSEVLVKKESCN